MGKIILIISILIMPLSIKAEREYFLGTKIGLDRTKEVFLEGRYKEQNLFLIIGANSTNKALRYLYDLKSKTTYIEDIESGAIYFEKQTIKAGKSIPINLKKVGYNLGNLIYDPIKSVKDLDVLTPFRILYKTTTNTLKIGWYGFLTVGEPVFRFGIGTGALVGAPLMKPIAFTGIQTSAIVTSTYGYGSSAVGGTVMLGATSAVLTLDLATSPFVGMYNLVDSRKTIKE